MRGCVKEDKLKIKMIAVIRIKGMVEVNKDIEETLFRLRLRRKYSCVVINERRKNIVGMVKKVKHFVSYGKIDSETLVELIKKRGQPIKKMDLEKNAAGIAEGIEKEKKLEEFGLKPFFRLHPPRKGINSKKQFPKGVLGENKKINELIRRML